MALDRTVATTGGVNGTAGGVEGDDAVALDRTVVTIEGAMEEAGVVG